MEQAADITQAFADSDETWAEPVDSALRAQVPVPAEAELSLLERIAAGHRVLLVRTGAVIAVSTLLSLLVALVINALMGGVVIWGMWSWSKFEKKNDPGTYVGLHDTGGSPGSVILGDVPGINAPPSPEHGSMMAGTPAALAAMPALPALPQLPNMNSSPAMAMMPSASPALLPGGNAETPRVPAPTPMGLPQGDNQGAAGTGSIASGTAESGLTGGVPGGEGGDRLHSWVNGKSGGGGDGGGIGAGVGSGIDRGMSIFDRPAQVLNQRSNARLSLPREVMLSPPEKDVHMLISIDEEGNVTTVKVIGSCGSAEVDELVRKFYMATARYSPAYKDGKAVASEVDESYSFHPF